MRVTGDHRGAGTKALSPWEVDRLRCPSQTGCHLQEKMTKNKNKKGGGALGTIISIQVWTSINTTIMTQLHSELSQ